MIDISFKKPQKWGSWYLSYSVHFYMVSYHGVLFYTKYLTQVLVTFLCISFPQIVVPSNVSIIEGLNRWNISSSSSSLAVYHQILSRRVRSLRRFFFASDHNVCHQLCVLSLCVSTQMQWSSISQNNTEFLKLYRLSSWFSLIQNSFWCGTFNVPFVENVWQMIQEWLLNHFNRNNILTYNSMTLMLWIPTEVGTCQ